MRLALPVQMQRTRPRAPRQVSVYSVESRGFKRPTCAVSARARALCYVPSGSQWRRAVNENSAYNSSFAVYDIKNRFRQLSFNFNRGVAYSLFVSNSSRARRGSNTARRVDCAIERGTLNPLDICITSLPAKKEVAKEHIAPAGHRRRVTRGILA